MALKPGDRANFQTLVRAAEDGNLCLMECTDRATGEYRATICAAQPMEDGTVQFTPLGHMFTGNNPFEDYVPPPEKGE